jgi:peptide-methionine (S)-S-oxide reductase
MSKNKEIIFGGGCFWCVEAVFQRLRGVESVEPGYAGGKKENPTYEQVCRGDSGHVEVARVVYNPDDIPLERLLDVFFTSHNPTTRNRQGNDIGEQYRSVVFYIDEEQKGVVEDCIKKLETDKVFANQIVTTVEPLAKFYPAENYHHDYYNRNQNEGYCQAVIEPKIAKLRQKFGEYLKEE